MNCPRRNEIGGRPGNNGDMWDSDDTCSYCGSLIPSAFFDAVRRGDEVTPTDKNYKAYVRLTSEKAIAQYRQEINEEMAREQKHPDERVETICQNPDTVQHVTKKVYFQHFTEEDKDTFISLLNGKQMRLGVPGHFYRLPFFLTHKPQVAQ